MPCDYRRECRGGLPERVCRSAELTADAWGRAYVLVTVSVPDWRAGGRVIVSREENPSRPGGPYSTLAVFDDRIGFERAG